MKWDAQITSLTVRLYEDEDSYAARDKYIAVAQLEIFSTGDSFMHAILKKDGESITMKQWNALVVLLVERFDIKTIRSERHGKEVTFDAVKLAEKHYKSQQEK